MPGELDAKAAAFLAEYTDDREPHALGPDMPEIFTRRRATGTLSMWDTLCWAMRKAKAGRFPAQHAVDALRYLWTEAIGGEYRNDDPDEFNRLLRDAVAAATRMGRWMSYAPEQGGLPLWKEWVLLRQRWRRVGRGTLIRCGRTTSLVNSRPVMVMPVMMSNRQTAATA